MPVIFPPVTVNPKTTRGCSPCIQTAPAAPSTSASRAARARPANGLDPHGHRDGPVGYWHVADIKEHQEVKDVGGGKLTAMVRDADGNVTGLIQSP